MGPSGLHRDGAEHCERLAGNHKQEVAVVRYRPVTLGEPITQDYFKEDPERLANSPTAAGFRT